MAAAAVVRLYAEDRAVVASATQEIGNGIYTLMTQVAADALKMPPRLFTVETTPRTRPLHTWDKSVLDGLVNANKQVRISAWSRLSLQAILSSPAGWAEKSAAGSISSKQSSSPAGPTKQAYL